MSLSHFQSMGHFSCTLQGGHEAAGHCSPDLTGTSTALQVHRQVHVAVMSTGDEVVDPSTQKLGPGQIRDANRSMLLAAASQAGAQVCAALCTLGAALAASGQVQGSPGMATTHCGQLLSLWQVHSSAATCAVLWLSPLAAVQHPLPDECFSAGRVPGALQIYNDTHAGCMAAGHGRRARPQGMAAEPGCRAWLQSLAAEPGCRARVQSRKEAHTDAPAGRA